ncbi:16S rRNA (guanine(966)-N(2))-methyltransferase RsmD [Legionella longbeachae]|uniref:Ribosomal RNA small subunit methyltransferase D n=1 Tax=Legionella longbeachae serogroup 1 (strain NSW150) TaxID=661367 RepID=D3HP85_LEGLN|nr:16S rRNA (guanine(966)-N(2))-methyltransferase RsmD [Legionella longbeachae]VEE01225.1 methyltransferase [Legionella oakridgensis]HBD7398336.1 16S rRNA (guanine(966)-N(2))-methyltransferase RsmD [Legionella pneumophila]ARB92405.1 16S rRNA (guanine(966)-N(2))-methyltransferase RsmD [Legionella longbeachae]ARM34414.1 16S rRNA (guanine(966)-N(2))-methyltransferase RsmD [Legionella longbeachae]EEZ96298.1 putative methyltransferase [Legionella longbeachae D-4968]
MKQSVRIIGGLYRGKKLYVPDEEGLRPTPDRVRETLFNWLMHDIREARCLDAFAGSGALGLEAFSRGAERVVFLEQSSKAFTNLQKVLNAFNSPKLKLLRTDALSYLKQSKEEFDLIFLDPPFAKNYLPQCIADITQSQIIKTGGLVYLESADAIQLDEHYWRKVKIKQAGQVVYGLFEKL